MLLNFINARELRWGSALSRMAKSYGGNGITRSAGSYIYGL